MQQASGTSTRLTLEKMRGLNLANVRVINLLGGAMAINYGEKTV